jgi:hypothetical protein
MILAVALLSAVPAFAANEVKVLKPPKKPLVEVPKPKEGRVLDRRFLIIMGLLASTKTADVITTRQSLDRGNIEINSAYRTTHPSTARLASMNVAYLAAEVGMAYVAKRYGRAHWWSKIWMVEPCLQSAQHVKFAIHNSQL